MCEGHPTGPSTPLTKKYISTMYKDVRLAHNLPKRKLLRNHIRQHVHVSLLNCKFNRLTWLPSFHLNIISESRKDG